MMKLNFIKESKAETLPRRLPAGAPDSHFDVGIPCRINDTEKNCQSDSRGEPPGFDFSSILLESRQQAAGLQREYCPPIGTGPRTCPARAQAKLAINKPGDKYEQEADRVAEQVMKMPETDAPLPSLISGQGQSIQNKCFRCDEDDDRVQQREGLPGQKAVNINRIGAPPIVNEVLRSPGQPLEKETKDFMESCFCHDFRQVRVHSDELAADSASRLNSRAYTVGSNIVFASGQYKPDTEEGRSLLAHELTHVLQQNEKSTCGLHSRPSEKSLYPFKQSKAVLPIHIYTPLIVTAINAPVIACQTKSLTESPNVPSKVALSFSKFKSPKAFPEPAIENVPDLSKESVAEVQLMISLGEYQAAIDIILDEVKTSKMPDLDMVVGKTMFYCPTCKTSHTSSKYDPNTNKVSNIIVMINKSAFSSPSSTSVAWLYSIMTHEYMELVYMIREPRFVARSAVSQFRALASQIIHATESGVYYLPDKMELLGEKLYKYGWEMLKDDEKNMLWEEYLACLKIVRRALKDEAWQPGRQPGKERRQVPPGVLPPILPEKAKKYAHQQKEGAGLNI